MLGLTLAEIFILLLFCFLFLIPKRQASEKQLPVTPTPTPSPTPSSTPEPEPSPAPAQSLNGSGGAGTNENVQLGYTNVGSIWMPISFLKLITNPVVTATPDSQTNPGGKLATSYIIVEDKPDFMTNVFSTTNTNSAPIDLQTPASLSGHRWPPIITLTEAEQYAFETGSAELSEKLRNALMTTIKDQIVEILGQGYGAEIIEVVGHTDERPITGYSNLNDRLVPALANQWSVNQLMPADNVGLGMARAVAVVKVLQSVITDPNIDIIPLSGGQAVELDDKLATGLNNGDQPSRRRIEIRLRQRNIRDTQQR
jgi:outer membrane protein OmpA-like peptidoglycan-associated protein